MDSAFYQSDVVAAVLRQRGHYSITARLLPPIRRAIDAIPADAWTPISDTNAVWDDEAQQWISAAEVAEIEFTAFSSRAKAKQVTARLIVRRVSDVNPATRTRCSPSTGTTPSSRTHRGRCSRRSPPTAATRSSSRSSPTSRPDHLPNCREVLGQQRLAGLRREPFNLTRTAGVLASAFHAKATTATIRAQLINVPGRLARYARRLTLHIPTRWPWQTEWEQLRARAAPPAAA